MRVKSLMVLLIVYKIAEIETHTSFEYKPNNDLALRPNPGNVLGQIIFSVDVKTATHRISPRQPPDETPAKPEIILEYNPVRRFYHSKPGNIAQIEQFGQTWSQIAPSTQNIYTPTRVAQEQPPISLEYKPMRPPFAPNPAFFIGQIVKPGNPWPANLEDFNKTNSVETTSKPLETNTVLEYKPTRPSFHPNPGDNVGQVMGPGQPLPDSPGESTLNLEDRLQETGSLTVAQNTESTTTQKQPSISLEYEPTRPSFHPNPGNNVGQIIPPGKPWPDSPEGYKNFSQSTPNIVDKLQETVSSSIQNIQTTTPSIAQKQPSISLEYEPMRPSFHPNPGNNVGPIIPSGEPWPDSLEGYNNRTSSTPNLLEDRLQETSSSTVGGSVAQTTAENAALEQTVINLEYNKPMRPFHQPNPGIFLEHTVPSSEAWPSSSEGYQNSNQSPTSSMANQTQLTISLEYEPIRPSFHPSPGNNVAQIVPPGNPLPNDAEGDKNQSTPNLTDRLQETNITQGQTPNVEITTLSTIEKQSSISLEYKPTRPFYHPNPGSTLGQIVSSGKPWPGSIEDYKNFSQTTPNIVDRIQETSSSPMNVLGSNIIQTTPKVQAQTPINLGYIPTRPFYASNTTNKPIVPPGQPWPNSAAGYQNFSQFASPPSINDRFKGSTTISTTTVQKSEGFVWEPKTSSEGTNTEDVTSSSDTEETPTSTVMSESTTNEITTTSGTLYTSASLQEAEASERAPPGPSVTNLLPPERREGYRFILMPFNVVPVPN